MRAAIYLLAFLITTTFLQGQTCIQKLDSADRFKYTNPVKAKFYANALLADLDSGRCIDELGLLGMYNNVGLILWEVKDKKRGLDAFLSGMNYELRSKDSTHQDLLGVYYNLSSYYQELGNYSEMARYMDLANRIMDTHFSDNEEKRIEFLYRNGVYHREVGNFKESLDELNRAITLAANRDDSTRIALLIETGTTYRHFGDLEKSEEELLKAIEIAEDKDELQYLLAIDRLSALKIEQGEYSDSENYLLYNLKIKEEKYSEDPIMLLETLNGLGGLYYKINDLPAADNYLSQARQVGSDIRTVRPYMFNNLGTIYMKQGELEMAEIYFRESAENFKELFGSMNPDYASSLNNLAGIYKERGQLGESLNLYTKVLDMDKVIYGEEHPRYATSLNNVAQLYLQLGHVSLAGKLLLEAKKIRRKTLGEYHPLFIKTVNDLGVYYLITADTIPAMEEFNLALDSEIKHMQDIFPVLTDKQRQLYFDETRNNVERFASLAFSDHFINTQYARDALNHFLNTKGILFYASEKMRRVIQASGDDKVIKTYNDWRDKKYRLAQAYLLTEHERSKQGITISHLEEECAVLEKELSLKFKVFSDQEKAAYHSWEEISAKLPDSAAMVDIIQYRDYKAEIANEEINLGFEDLSNYMAFIIGPDSLLIPVKWSRYTDFEKGFALYRNALNYGIRDKSSYDVFWEPVDKHLEPFNKIYLSNDGIFHKLNPGVFYNNAKKTYIADAYNIVNVTSGKDLIYTEDKSLIRDARIFGNPDFSNLVLDNPLKQLPGAEMEANDITGILDVRRWDTETYNFAEATEQRIKTLSNPGIIHIATHGYFDDDPNHADPLHSSGLYLSKSQSSENDGLLSAYEAMNLLLDQTSLVVLAACETGLGTVANGEGVFGLQRAFLVAGADNVLISLVKINDQAARKFMNLFYNELLQEEDPQVAFFNARATFKEQDKNPYNWGAYILVSKS